MRHVHLVTKRPVAAQTGGICDEIGSDFQARLCFLMQLFTGFLLPLAAIKNGLEPN